MREPVSRSGSWPGLDDVTFDAAVERVVARVIAAPADDTAGARVVARLQATPSWHGQTPRLMLAPAAVLMAVLAVAYLQRTAHPPVESAAAVRPGQRPVIAASVAETPDGTADAGDTTRQAPVPLIGAAPRALASSARRRSRTGAAAPSVEQGTSLPPIDTATAIDLDALNDSSGEGAGPRPLPVDALELIVLDPYGAEPRHEN